MALYGPNIQLKKAQSSVPGRFFVGGGGHSDAKRKILQFSPFFPEMSFHRGGVCDTSLKSLRNGPFEKVWVGGGGGRRPYFFPPNWNFLAFWCLLPKAGLVCMMGFTVLGPVLQHVISMANFSAKSE